MRSATARSAALVQGHAHRPRHSSGLRLLALDLAKGMDFEFAVVRGQCQAERMLLAVARTVAVPYSPH